MKITIKWNHNALKSIYESLHNGLDEMATDVARKSYDLSPVISGALRMSTQIQKAGDHATSISVGGIWATGDVTGEFKFVDYAYKRWVSNVSGTDRFLTVAADQIFQTRWKSYFIGRIK